MSRTLSELPKQSLSQIERGIACVIGALQGSQEICRRLREVGFLEDMEICKLSDGHNIICQLCGSKMALSRELAECILITPKPAN